VDVAAVDVAVAAGVWDRRCPYAKRQR